MKKHLSKKRVVLAAIVVVALAIASGVAYAYFTSSGNGPGTAGVGTSSVFTVTQVGAPSDLLPNGVAQDVTVHVKNEATFTQSLSAVAISVASATGGCNTDWFTTTPPVIATPPIVLAAGASTNLVGTIKMNENGENQNSCKSSTLTLAFAVS